MTGTINDHIDARLNELRPDRYTCGDLSWAHTLYDEIGADLTDVEARTIAARTIVANRERSMVQSANRAMRVAADGQEPLAWMAALNLPIVVGDERVRLSSATADDLDAFADQEGARAQHDYDVRMATVRMARSLASRMRHQRVGQLSLLDRDKAAA